MTAAHPPKGTPTCALCKRTDQLCGVNLEWFCPDHITVGIGRAFAPVRALARRLGL